MDIESIMKRINWKTTACAAGYLLCNVVGSNYPQVEHACGMLDKLFVALGILSAADAGRVQNIVAAVDTLLWKNKLDPETLRPVTPGVVGIGGEAPVDTTVTVLEKTSGV